MSPFVPPSFPVFPGLSVLSTPRNVFSAFYSWQPVHYWQRLLVPSRNPKKTLPKRVTNLGPLCWILTPLPPVPLRSPLCGSSRECSFDPRPLPRLLRSKACLTWNLRCYWGPTPDYWVALGHLLLMLRLGKWLKRDRENHKVCMFLFGRHTRPSRDACNC